jgi:hypothetical protein
MSPERRVLFRRALAVVFVLRALTNLGKPLGTGTGLVFFGTLITGTPMLIVAPLLGAYMIVWAWGLWHATSWARPMGAAYVCLVLVNVLRFPMQQPLPPGVNLAMYAAYGAVALGVPVFALWLLREVYTPAAEASPRTDAMPKRY